MKNLIEVKITMNDMIMIDFIFCWMLDKTIHLGINPINGGIPLKDKIKIDMLILLFFFICWVNSFMFFFLKFIMIVIEIIL